MQTELFNLLSAAFDGALDETESKRLGVLLLQQESSNDFNALLDLHLRLAEITAPVRSFSIQELRAVVDVESRFEKTYAGGFSAGTVPGKTESTPQQHGKKAIRSRGQWAWFAGGLAASLLLVLPFASVGGRSEPIAARQPDVQPVPADKTTPEIAARIVRKIDCIWENDRWMVSSPAHFRSGESISLTSGLLVLEFQSGAQVTLQGPARAAAISANSLSLISGGMTAMVPEQAQGFTVHTNSGEIIDLGTEFGVLALEDGTVETHVFKGEVVTKLGAANSNAPLSEVSLTAGKAHLYSTTGNASTGMAEPARFLRLGFGYDREEIEKPPIDRDLILWLAADGRLQLDAQGRVTAWGDNPTATNSSIEDVWQVKEKSRPYWENGAINGRPAILFGPNKRLVTEPIEVLPDITVTSVFQLQSDRAPNSFSLIRQSKAKRTRPRPDLGLQLVNLYGPPHPVVQINEDLSLSARVHLGQDPNHLYDNDVGVATTEPITDDAPHVVVYVFDSAEAVARLYLDGALISVIKDAPKLPRTYAPRYIGQHPYRMNHGFPGHIAEVMLHDAALQPSEAVELSAWLGRKYGIPTEPQ